MEDCNLGTQCEPKLVKLFKGVPKDYKKRYIDLFKKFADVFSWSYEDLKTYDKTIIQHKIPLKDGIKPHRQKLRQINPLLLAPIEKEVKKLLPAKIIVPLRYSHWVSNILPVRKKNGEIRLCVYFRNLNRASLKDNYPLPKMDFVLQKVTRAYSLSMVDSFSGYNQVAVEKEDQKKTTFTTPWGTFMYARMPFGLMNARDTFQRAMDIAFVGDKFVVIYLDDVTIFSNSNDEHLQHFHKAFLKCRKYGLSLNPKNYFFSLEEGKFLGHIVSKSGVKIDTARVEAIQMISLP